MSQKDRDTLVIGGAGYIGIHLVRHLVATGRSVTVLGRSKLTANELPQNVSHVAGDFGELDLIGSLLDRHHEVIHLAYATVPNTSFENPLADLLQNLPPTVQLFSEVARRNRKLLMVSSGGTVYGEALNLPISENHSTKPISPYGVTKLTLENYAHLYGITHGLKIYLYSSCECIWRRAAPVCWTRVHFDCNSISDVREAYQNIWANRNGS